MHNIDSPIPGTDDITYDTVTCHKYGNKRHSCPKCPALNKVGVQMLKYFTDGNKSDNNSNGFEFTQEESDSDDGTDDSAFIISVSCRSSIF